MATGTATPEPPSSLRPNVFPRRLLRRDEVVIFETRPGLFARYWGRLIAVILLALLFLAPVGEPGYASNPAFPGLEAIFLLLILWMVLLWRGTGYVLTNQRVMAVYGVRQSTVAALPYEMIQGLNLSPGSSDIVFSSVPPAVPGKRAMGPSEVRWRNVPDPSSTYDYIQQVFGQSAMVRRTEATRKALLAKALEGKVPCAYCRGLIDVTTVNAASPKCPRCGAPLLAPGDLRSTLPAQI